MPSRLAAFVSAFLALVAVAPAAQAQDFPNRPIRMVIAFPAGGPTDFVGRLVADKVKDILGQPVIIENKPGANGALGADSVAKAAPDGYTLFLSTVGAVAITPHMRTDLPYDTLRDFAPVTHGGAQHHRAGRAVRQSVQVGEGICRCREGETGPARLRHDRRGFHHASRRWSFSRPRPGSSSCTCLIVARHLR